MNNTEIKQQLENRLDALKSRLMNIKSDVTQAHSVDSAEQAQERENDEVVDAIGNETRASIAEIEAALERLEAGTYGICGECGGPIGEGRLDAIPEATRCVDCAV